MMIIDDDDESETVDNTLATAHDEQLARHLQVCFSFCLYIDAVSSSILYDAVFKILSTVLKLFMLTAADIHLLVDCTN